VIAEAKGVLRGFWSFPFFPQGRGFISSGFGVRYGISAFLILCWSLLIKTAYPGIDLVNLEMTFLAWNVLIVLRFGQGPAIFSSVLSVMVFDFLFVPPFYNLTMHEPRHWLTFAIMVAVTTVIGRLVHRSESSAKEALAAELKAEREKLINSLLSSISHDLRTPLTSIAGASSTLLEHAPQISPPDRQRLLETVQEESTRLNRLVEKILQITKIESGNIRLRKELRAMEEVVGSVLHRLDLALGDRWVTVEIPDDLMVPLDDLLIEQVLVNLLENAIRYSPEDSPIDICAYAKGARVWIEIADRGGGVPDSEKPRIFEKFHRCDPAQQTGSGLGLAVCQGILKIHEGQLGVKDREGGGSVFYFSLPT